MSRKWNADYGWPVMHKVGWPDLEGGEVDIYNYLQVFNSRSRAIKAVFINQFGFDRIRCGQRVPADAEFADLRIGSDAELGFSIYEPFGIAQIETIPVRRRCAFIFILRLCAVFRKGICKMLL